MHFLIAQATAAPIPTGELWETAKGVMLTVCTAGIIWTSRTVFLMRDGLRDLRTIVVGEKGDNGIRGKVKDNSNRLDLIEERNLKIDTVAAAAIAAGQHYDGPERREFVRRVQDAISDIAIKAKKKGEL